MYNLNGIELNLNHELLKKYSEIICSEVNSDSFNESISWLGEIMLKVDSLAHAIDLYGINVVSQKIEKAIQNELALYIEQDNSMEIN